ncbi:hypothetical protein D9619_004074 [Psilocybe cf. subviscida]|uniref:Uncharacterized protein n=1 Tax=Psilocybe cf. subviscida TaxID=2480587 RepID=A0A8H5F8S3_9AGAR|nr:hypothetical protein D9619_004074 [Psilocybe cf. subviscida]
MYCLAALFCIVLPPPRRVDEVGLHPVMDCLHANADSIVSMDMTERLKGLNQHLEELHSELAVSIREKKVLRGQDVFSQYGANYDITEVAKVSMTLELSKRSCASLQKQYQNNAKYHDDWEKTIRNLKKAISLHEIATNKWTREYDACEDGVALL